MGLKRTELTDEFIRLITNYNSQVVLNGTINHQDINVDSEDFIMLLLNYLFDWNLVNANTIKRNYPGIDLIDEDNKIAIQVTSDYSSAKINHTLNLPIMKKLAEENYKLEFCFIGSDNLKKKRLSSFSNPYCVNYKNKENDIVIKDIIQAYQSISSLDKKYEILSLVQRELGENSLINR